MEFARTSELTVISPASLTLTALAGIPAIRAGDPLGRMLADAMRALSIAPVESDILVVAQKIVSKAEGRMVRLADVTPSARAAELAAYLGIDPRKIEIILGDSRTIVRAEQVGPDGHGVIISETHQGLVCANAGVDESNLDESECALRLPENPDASAARIRDEIAAELGVSPGVIITDSFGRPWRSGLVNVAIGVAGAPARIDLRGRADSAGRPLQSTELAVADEIAAAAGLLMGKLDRIPAVVVRGCAFGAPPGRAADLIRAEQDDLFRS